MSFPWTTVRRRVVRSGAPAVPGHRGLAIAAVLLIGALGARLARVEATSYRPLSDARSYLTLAGQIARSGDYAISHRPGAGAGGTRGPSAYYAPGFPYFLAAAERLSGQTAGSSAVDAARLSQALLGTVIVALIGLVAFEAFGSAAAIIALGLAAAYPVLIELSGALVAENLLTALMLAAAWAALRARRATRPRLWMAAGGALSGLATVTHLNGVVLLAPLAYSAWRLKPRLDSPALVLAAAALAVAPWTVRNAVVLHRFIPVSDETGVTLAGTYNSASASNRRIPYAWRIFYTIPGEQARSRPPSTLTEPELGSELLRQARGYIADHPLAPLAAAYHNARRLLELEGSFAWRASAYGIGVGAAMAKIAVVSFWLLAAVALAGAFTARARRAPGWLWWTPILFALSVVLVNAETPRFREPVDPFLLMLAGCALAEAAKHLVPARASRAFWVPRRVLGRHGAAGDLYVARVR